MRGGAVRFEGGVVLVLLVDEEPPRFCAVTVYLIHQAARFLAALFGKLGEYGFNFRFASCFCHPGYSQNNHCSLRS
jgi:hypothetical protein